MSARKAQPADTPPSVSMPLFVIGLLLLAFSGVMSFMLVYEHVTGHAIPGCGEDSACAQLAEGFAGKIALGSLEWPTAHLGLAYFLAALAAWVSARGALPTSLRYVARLGVLGSVFFCIVIVVKWMFCPYCLAAHAGNAAFWVTMEVGKARTRRPVAVWAAALIAFVLASIAIGIWQRQVETRRIAKGEQDMAESVEAIIQRSHQPSPATQPTATPAPRQPQTGPAEPIATEWPAAGVDVPGEPNEPDPNAFAGAEEPDASTQPSEHESGFEGRYRYGPKEAPIRIVMITSYQCPDCRSIEGELHQILRKRKDIAVSIKHFPFNNECNPLVSRTTQPNACWAARAAEAAGMIWGVEGFWTMHTHLFKIQGAFTRAEDLKPGFLDPNFPVADFLPVMTGEETLERVQADCREGRNLGLYFTPMIFINGVELKGWWAPRALTRTVEAVAASNPPPRSSAHDHPPKAAEKYVADWRDQPLLTLPADEPARGIGPQDATLRIVMWGDYQEKGTADADATIRAFIADRTDARYTFRHFPFNSDCNSLLTDQRHPLACRASQAAEAAAQLGGDEAYWRMHIWLMENVEQFSDQTLRAAAVEMELDPNALFNAMGSEPVKAAIAQDVELSQKLPRLRIGTNAGVHSIPTIFVNERWVPRWKLAGTRVFERIMTEAAESQQQPAGQ